MQRGSVSRFALRSLFASCGMFRRETPSRPRIPCVYGLEVGGRRRTWLIGIRVPFAVSRFARKARYFGMSGRCGCCGDLSLLLFRGFAAKSTVLWDGWGTWLLRQLIPAINYPWHTCANDCSCYTCNCCFRAGWNSPLVVNRAVPRGYRGAGKVPAVEPMSPRPGCALVRMPAELVRFQYQRLESG